MHKNHVNPNLNQSKMKKTNQTLEQQLAETKKASALLEKKSADLLKKIEAKKNANKPKDIIDRVKSLKDVFKIAKPTKEELVILNYKGRSKRVLFAKYMMILSLISEVLNEGTVLKMDDERHYPYFFVSSGFVFRNTGYGDSCADAASASRLALKNDKLARHAGTIFLKEYKDAITLC